jgi:hypothetical protein
LKGYSAHDDWLSFASEELEKMDLSTGVDFIERREVPDLLKTAGAYTAINEWSRWKRFGLPNAKGWKHEHPVLIQVIELVDQEESACMESLRNEGKRVI